MRPKRNHWYVIGWLDRACEPALYLGMVNGNPQFFFPNFRGNGAQVDTIDDDDQVLAELATGEIPALPPRYKGHICETDRRNRLIRPK